MSRKRKRVLWGGSVLVLALAGGWFAWSRGPEPTPVDVAAVERRDLQAKVTANGKVQAQRKVDISATIAGEVTRLAVQEGDRVTKGQFLLQIDPVTPRAAARSTEASMQALLRELDAARASRELAEADFRRAEDNHRERLIPDAEFQRAQTELSTREAAVAAAERRVAQARATLEGAEDALKKTTVRAPMDGIVTARRVEEGEVAVIGIQNSPGTVLLTISDMSVVETELEVDETSIPNVAVGQEARVRVDAYPNRTFGGVVTSVGSSPITQTGQNEAVKFEVKVQIIDPPEGVKPGLSVQADILTGFRAAALVVPIQALVIRDAEAAIDPRTPPGGSRDVEGVYLLEDGSARFRPIRTGLLGELHVEVLEGLSGGESLVTGPFRALRALEPGDPVRERTEEEREGE